MNKINKNTSLPIKQKLQEKYPPDNLNLSKLMNLHTARFDTRYYDWNILDFQSKVNPLYRRAQIRYVGTGGTGLFVDNNVVPASNFTFSIMLMPIGSIGPMHIHNDVEEIFFILQGQIKVICEKNNEIWETICSKYDLVSVPPGIYRSVINIDNKDSLMCVMLGSSKPITPTYPPNSKLAKIKRKVFKKNS